MNLYTILIIISLYVGPWLCLHSNFAVIQAPRNESVILKEIITNYLQKYFRDAQIYVSIIFSPSENGKYSFLDEFFTSPFDRPMQAQNILNKLDNSIRENRNAFNLILVNNIKSLQ